MNELLEAIKRAASRGREFRLMVNPDGTVRLEISLIIPEPSATKWSLVRAFKHEALGKFAMNEGDDMAYTINGMTDEFTEAVRR